MKQSVKDKIAKANTGKRKKKPEPIPECCRCTCLEGCSTKRGVFEKCPCNLHKVKHKKSK